MGMTHIRESAIEGQNDVVAERAYISSPRLTPRCLHLFSTSLRLLVRVDRNQFAHLDSWMGNFEIGAYLGRLDCVLVTTKIAQQTAAGR